MVVISKKISGTCEKFFFSRYLSLVLCYLKSSIETKFRLRYQYSWRSSVLRYPVYRENRNTSIHLPMKTDKCQKEQLCRKNLHNWNSPKYGAEKKFKMN